MAFLATPFSTAETSMAVTLLEVSSEMTRRISFGSYVVVGPSSWRTSETMCGCMRTPPFARTEYELAIWRRVVVIPCPNAWVASSDSVQRS